MTVIMNLNLINTGVNPNIQTSQKHSAAGCLREGETIMTSFVHREYAQEHPGVIRAERVAQAFRQAAKGFSGTRATASLMLAAVVAALVVTANQVMDSWTDGNLMAAWIVLWTIAFAASALLAVPVRQAVSSLRSGLTAWSARRRETSADEQLWKLALTDARVMADISRAMSHDTSGDLRARY